MNEVKKSPAGWVRFNARRETGAPTRTMAARAAGHVAPGTKTTGRKGGRS